MKILYLVDPQSCYLTSMMMEGFCSLLGEKNIYTYPILKRWKHGTADDWYTLPDGKRGYTGKVDYERIYSDIPELTIDDICNNIDMFDYIILASPREYVIKSFIEIRNRCPFINAKIVYMDGEDGSNINKDIINAFNPDFLFKREMFYDMQHNGKKIYPLPFSAFTSELRKPLSIEKNTNVFGIFGNTNNLRIKIVNEFNRFNIENSIVDIDSGSDNWDRNKPRQGKMSYHDYMNKISNSKIGLSCIGHGKDCVRYWEIPTFNTLMMCIDPKILIPFPFKNKETCVIIKEDLSNFKELLDYYLTHDKEREEIAMAGYEHLKKYHTTDKRAMYMLSVMESSI